MLTKLSQWVSILFCSLPHGFLFQSHEITWSINPRRCSLMYMSIRTLDYVIFLHQANLSKTTKHWDGFVSHCRLPYISALKHVLKHPELNYTALIYYLQRSQHQYWAFNDFPHPRNALILSPQAKTPLQLHHGEYTFSCWTLHQANSTIRFYNLSTQTHATGFIERIWQVPLEGSMQSFVVVWPHAQLSNIEEERAPFQNSPGFMSQIVDAKATEDKNPVIIEPNHIITHLTTFWHPEGTYGIQKRTLIMCWALNRGCR